MGVFEMMLTGLLSRTGFHWRPVTTAIALTMLTGVTAHAQEGPAALLKTMSDYLGSQKSVSFAFDSDIEVVTPNLRKIQFANSGRTLLSRPDKLRVSRTGGYADVEFVYDGKTATLLGKSANLYAQVDASGTVADIVEQMRSRTPLGMPGADLFTMSPEELIADAYEGNVIGLGVIDGTECHHLAFRSPEVDWQLWIEVGSRPIPRKYVITSKTTAGAPQYTIRITDWKSNESLAADAFNFAPPANARKVDLTALTGLDELPDGVHTGASK
jgi:hypothetical protein